MRVAIPVLNGRVSPVFDTAQRVVVVNVGEGRTGQRDEHSLQQWALPEKVRMLSELGVEVLLCGGISQPAAAMVQGAAIRLVPWVAGEVSEVLDAFFQGQLNQGRFLMPGCGRRGRRFRGGRGRRRWR